MTIIVPLPANIASLLQSLADAYLMLVLQNVGAEGKKKYDFIKMALQMDSQFLITSFVIDVKVSRYSITNQLMIVVRMDVANNYNKLNIFCGNLSFFLCCCCCWYRCEYIKYLEMKKLFYFKFMEIVTEGDVPVISSHFGRKCRIAMFIDFQLNEECHKKNK